MTPLASPASRFNAPLAAAVTVAGGGAATILGALYFQYVLRYEPCVMCLQQRIPYYVVIPLAGVLAVGAARRGSSRLIAAGLWVCALVMLGCAVFAAFHAGVEWKWWPGPAGCSGATVDFGRAADLLKTLETMHMPSCDAAAVRIFGLSLAGWNALIALALAVVAAVGARVTWQRAA